MNDRKESSGIVKKLHRFLLVALMSVVTFAAAAQTKTINGQVTDEQGEPIIGATVQVKGTSIGTPTDIDGNYSLKNVPNDATLVFSYIGCLTEEVKVNGRTTINVVLKENASVLEDLVVVGYGTQKKSDVTGALSHVDSKELQSRPVSNALEALQGKAAGVDITTNERPGTVGSIRIRGERSLKSSSMNEPLYVVDGVPLMGTGIETLNPRDIESIDILKDASATAIYGSRGANGVVIVTTKSGKPGQFSLNYSGSVTWQNLVDKNKAVSASDYITYRRWAAYNADPTKYADPRNPTKESDALLFGTMDDTTGYNNIMRGWSKGSWDASLVEDYDWTGQALRTGLVQEHTVSASGGTEKMNAFGSFGYLNNKGTQRGQEYNRYTARVGANITPVKWMTISMNLTASRAEQEYGMSSAYAPSSTNSAGSIYELYKKVYRYALPFTEDGERIRYPGGDNTCYNPYNEWENNISNRLTYRVLGSFSATLHLGEIWAPLKGLEYKILFGPDYQNYRQGDYVSPLAAYKFQSAGTGASSSAKWSTNTKFSWTLDNMITYNRTFLDVHNVGLTLLQTATKYNIQDGSMSVSNIPIDSWKWNNMGFPLITDSTNGASMGTGVEEKSLESYMIRLNYGFNDRYLLTASGRWDGASQLSEGRKWAFFPSMSLGWRIQQESFLRDVQWLSNLKIRAGVGTTGNSAIGAYETLGAIRSMYVPTSDGNILGFAGNEPAYWKDNLVMANTEVGWEKTTQWNFGIDFGVLNNRINGSLEYYISHTKDLLLAVSIPSVNGYDKTTGNIGETKNHGIEFTINAIPVDLPDFTWTTTLNGAWQANEIVALANGKEDDVANKWFIGREMGVLYGWNSDGLWTDSAKDAEEMAKWKEASGRVFSPGMVKPLDLNGDYDMTDADRYIIGNTRPKFTAGWSNTFNYKGIELSCQMYGRFNYWVQQSASLTGFGQLGSAIDYWTPDNTNSEYQKPIYIGSVQGVDQDAFSGLRYKKANFIRMRNISLGYNLPAKWIEKATLKNAKIYGQVINPFDIWQSVKGRDLDTNLSYYNRSWVVGVELGF